MSQDPMDLYSRASEWTLNKVTGAVGQMESSTDCEPWDVRTLLNHMLETERYFIHSARGESASLPAPTPPRLLSDDPLDDFRQARDDSIEAFRRAGVGGAAGAMVSIAFSDQLLHGWDLAKATGQDATMPPDLADAAYAAIHGKFTDEQRAGKFKPEIAVEPGASTQDKLLAYTGRDPSA